MRAKAAELCLRIGSWLFTLLLLWHFLLVLLLGAPVPNPAGGLVYKIGSVYVTAFAFYLQNALFFASIVFCFFGMNFSPNDDEAPKSDFKFSRYPLLATALAVSYLVAFTSILVQAAFDFFVSPPLSDVARRALAASKTASLIGVAGCFLFMIALAWRANKDKSASRDVDKPPTA